MKNSLPILLLVMVLCVLPANQAVSGTEAAPVAEQIITLKDGTILKGKLVEVAGNDYLIETKNLGRVHIPASELVSITNSALPPSQPSIQPTAGNPANFASMTGVLGGGGLSGFQQEIMKDPQLTGEILELLKDPELVQLLSNPAFLNDLMSSNPDQIQNNPTVQQLLANPQFRKIMGAVQEKMVPGANSVPASTP